MANQNIEIEIRFPLQNPEDIKNFLNKNGTLVSENVFQKDTYFMPIHRNFLDAEYPSEWLRLRETTKGYSINYKHFYPENVKKTDYCDEFETKIENIESMKKILQSLDMKESVTVEKERSTRIFDNVEIVIDDVRDLGSYIELESRINYKSAQDTKNELYRILEKLNAKIGDEDLRGYPFKILENKGYKFGE